MQLSWLGNSAFKITEKEVSVVIDPFTGMGKTQADIVLLSSGDDRQSALDTIKTDSPFVIDTPGEFEVKGVFVYGVSGKTSDGGATTFWKVEIDGVTIAHLAGIGQDQLTEAQLEILEGSHILLLPLEGGLTPEQAVNITNRLEPRIVIPMQYQKADAFIDEIGIKAETIDKLKAAKKDLPAEDMKLYILEQA